MTDSETEKSAYSPPELTEYGGVEPLTEQGYGPPDEVPGPPDDIPGRGSGGFDGFF